MIRCNENYAKLAASYLFSEIARRTRDFQAANPTAKIIRLGIGDVTRELPKACIEAMHKAVDEMAVAATFRGYGPEQGYPFLTEKIAKHDFQDRGARIDADEIFVSDGAKCDTGNIQEIFASDIKIAVPDPVYPVYVDTNVMAGRTGANANGRYEGLEYLECSAASNFLPSLPQGSVDLIYLCSPNNPTGSVMTRAELTKWVDYARRNKALILFDAAYEIFIRDNELPRSIFEIEGAKEVAIEFRSYSKTAGFTGTRCAYTVVPKACRAYTRDGKEVSLRDLWFRRQATKFNGVSYIVQRGAEAVYTEQGMKETRAIADFYLENAAIIAKSLQEMGYRTWGGEHAPYVWMDCKRDSWEFFDRVLKEAHVVCTPGAGFGKCGEGFVRFSAFNTRENVEAAVARLKKVSL